MVISNLFNVFKVSTASLLIVSVALVVGLAFLTGWLTDIGNQPFNRKLIEFPIWAVALGLIASIALKGAGAKEALSKGFNAELYLKAGLILLGASVNIANIVKFGALGIVQALILITSVFFFTWWLAGKFRLDKKLSAVLATAISVCGVSAAIAAAGSVLAKKEDLVYVTTLVVMFAMPLMVLMPPLAHLLNLSDNVAGAWMGGNIDTTAAVVGAGKLFSEGAMKIASIVKLSQNALIGVVAFLLALFWVVRVERNPEHKPSAREIWDRFPKFVLGFIAMSVLASLGFFSKSLLGQLDWLKTFLLSMAFVSMGLTFSLGNVKAMGAKPIWVFAIATVFNTTLAFIVSSVLFA